MPTLDREQIASTWAAGGFIASCEATRLASAGRTSRTPPMNSSLFWKAKSSSRSRASCFIQPSARNYRRSREGGDHLRSASAALHGAQGRCARDALRHLADFPRRRHEGHGAAANLLLLCLPSRRQAEHAQGPETGPPHRQGCPEGVHAAAHGDVRHAARSSATLGTSAPIRGWDVKCHPTFDRIRFGRPGASRMTPDSWLALVVAPCPLPEAGCCRRFRRPSP